MELRKTILTGTIVGLLALSLAGTGAGEIYVIDGNWEYETIDIATGSSYGWWSSIGVDSDGNIAMIHGNYYWEKLRETHWNGTGWESEYISENWTAWLDDDLEVQGAWDSNGVAHAVHAYWTTPLREVLHTYWNGTGWETETVTSNVGQADYVAIAVGPNGYPHIVYVDGGYDDVGGGSPWGLIYAVWNGVSWDIGPIDAGSEPYTEPSITVDSNNKPHISYIYRNLNVPLGEYPELWYGEKTGVSWTLVPIRTDIVCGKNDIIMDSNDKPHIVFSDYTNDCLVYEEKTGSSWSETYFDCVNEPLSPSIILDDNDHPHFAYIIDAPFNANLAYAMYDGYNWYGEVVDDTQDTFWYGTDIMIHDGTVHISYQQFFTPDAGLKYATYNLTYMEWSESHGIYGNVYLLPLYSEGRDTYITCKNDNFSTSTTANNTGYYIFETLATGFYWVNATLHSYFDNNALVEVVSRYNQTLLNGCDAL